MKIEPSEMPISAANSQNSICDVAGRIRSMPKLSTKTSASGDSMITHFSGLTKMRVADRRQEQPAADLRRKLRAVAHHLGGRRGVAGDRQHVDAERGEAGDGEAEHHVIVNLQHVGSAGLGR